MFADPVTVESVSVLEGDSVTLNSGRTEMMDYYYYDLILWRFGSENTLNQIKSNQIKSNQITFIVTSPQHKCLGE